MKLECFTSCLSLGRWCIKPHLFPLSPFTQGHLAPSPHQKRFVSLPGFPNLPLRSNRTGIVNSEHLNTLQKRIFAHYSPGSTAVHIIIMSEIIIMQCRTIFSPSPTKASGITVVGYILFQMTTYWDVFS